ncbi:uncharacterized protein F5891DRAFT_1071994 [Suillus fuscotomentosus]|uniref:Uncharacterized protein n=1 Tax=Suillus fuscotomentosus TaxID=1912939 RepID=A0AAD4HD37_9AGAM|nr:uncharacterized protein F5891DRAFT_1071994 [Suillus fuscotomentosus]KAG1890478.1 hypothetical protein F5891DRAFT_1071994 [Suillus fuscotomentosus]
MRPLILHVSALNDLEYNLFTSSLNDLAVSPDTVHDDAHFEVMSVGVREVRAWLRGRYPNLPTADIDKILKLFYPNLLHTDCLTGGQFFAALRLVLHAVSGKRVDRALAFVQAHPTPELFERSRSTSPSKRQVHAPPVHPDRPKQNATSSNSSSPDTNPFRKSLESDTQQSLSSVPDQSDTPLVIPSRMSQKISHNPFLMRDKANWTDAAQKSPEHNDANIPPLPPRKPAPLVAQARRTSLAQSRNAPVLAPFDTPRSIKPSHITTPLMKQSLEASKHGQNLKRVEEQLDRARVLQVLKTTSSGSSASSRPRSLSPTKQFRKGLDSRSSGSEDTCPAPPLPRRRTPSSPSSTSSSLPSIDQVASASLNTQSSYTPTPFRPPLPTREPTLPENSLIMTPDVSSHLPAPPTHPDRRPTNDTAESITSSSTRPTRSKSLRHTATPPVPPRRKRPESIQITAASITTELPSSTSAFPSHTRTSSFQGLSRHISFTRDRDATDASPMSHIQKTISNLQLKAQPKLDAARYKAEAGLSRRGFVHHSHAPARWMEEGEQGLMTDTHREDDDGAHVDRDPNTESPTDDEPSSGEDLARMKNSGVHRDFLKEKDNLKWPAGEGWRPL